YQIERGVRFHAEPIDVIGFRRHVIETKQPLLDNRDAHTRAREFGQPGPISGEPAKAVLFVPLMVAGEATGVISLQNLDHDDAFSDADVRLLTTLAASLTVALENARLIDETRPDEPRVRNRAAELATRK